MAPCGGTGKEEVSPATEAEDELASGDGWLGLFEAEGAEEPAHPAKTHKAQKTAQ